MKFDSAVHVDYESNCAETINTGVLTPTAQKKLNLPEKVALLELLCFRQVPEFPV